MSDWSFDRITDHRAVILSRPTSQYQNAERLKHILTIEGDRTQDIENALYTLLTDRWLDDAEGKQLDELGDIVGEPRLGRLDETYREAIGVRITLSRGGGEPEIIIAFCQNILGAEDVRLQELFPAKLRIFLDVDVTAAQAARIRSIVAAGVGTVLVETSGGLTPFGFSELGEPAPVDVAGFGELGDDPMVGGALAELFEV